MLDDVASLTLQSAILGLGQRQQVIANNIANSETPNFTASNVQFESALAAAVAQGDPTTATPSVTPTTDAAGPNGNNVVLENEFVGATKTTLEEQLLTGVLTSKYGWLSTVLKG